MVTVFGRRVLIPMGTQEPYLNMSIGMARGKHPRPRPVQWNNPGLNRQVVFSQIRMSGVVGGEETADAYYLGWCDLSGDPRYSLSETGVTDYGKFVIICEGCSDKDAIDNYKLYWFTPNEDHAFQVAYSVDPIPLEALGGMIELRRFAERLRLLPD